MPEERILIAEDERIIAEDIKGVLENFGYIVSSIVSSGTDAIRSAQEDSPDLVIMDIMLSGTMDGIEAAKSIHERFNIPIVFLTAYVDENLLKRAKAIKPFGYLLKPFQERELYSTIEIALSKNKKEMALVESEEFSKSLLDNTPNPILVINPDTSIRFVNPSFERLTGFSCQEIIGQKHPYSWWTKEQRERSQRDFMHSFCAEVKDFEQYYQNKNGECFRVLTNFTPVFRNGELKFCLSNWMDITEKMEAEKEKQALQAQLLQMQKMEAIGNLAGGIAHDFNNILSLIIGYTELARDEVSEGSQAWKDLKEVYQAGKRARDLVKHILAFSRQNEQEQKPTHIQPIVKQALKLLRPLLPANIEIRRHITATGMVLADSTQIEQVIINLCTNASQAMRERGGVLELRLEEMVLEGGLSRRLDLPPGTYLALTVHDTGHGIHGAIIDRIFEPYFTTKETGEGTGIGLAVVHGIVKKHGGAITVDSKPDKGATFQVLLPKCEDAEVREEPKEVAPPSGGMERILFVDDEPGIVNMGKRMLEGMNYEVVAITSSIKALEVFRKQQENFGMVITDMTMPKMTGDRLATELLSIRPGIPIILCTGFNERITQEKAKEMGIRKFVMKPLVMAELAEAVREVLDAKC